MEVGQLPWGVALTVWSWSPITYALDREYFDLIGPSITLMDMIGLNYLTAFWMRDFEYAPWLRHDINHSITEMGLYVWLFPINITHFEVVFTWWGWWQIWDSVSNNWWLILKCSMAGTLHSCWGDKSHSQHTRVSLTGTIIITISYRAQFVNTGIYINIKMIVN